MIVETLETAQRRYKTIYADPPWYEHGGIACGANRHYSLLKTKHIAALPVQGLAHPDGCHLYLWATNNFLRDAFDVMAAWGFKYITTITWFKDSFGIGQYYRGTTEHCLFGRRGQPPYKIIEGKRAQGVTGFVEAKREHSVKPERMRHMIELVSYEPRIELFAREVRAGWDCWGHGVKAAVPATFFRGKRIKN